MDLKITNKANAIQITTPESKNFLVNGYPICTLPVGTILEFIEDISPAQIYGGTWLRFGEGRVTVGYKADSKYDWTKQTTNQEGESLVTYNVGGEETHTLTKEEMPTHNHNNGFSSLSYVNDQPIAFGGSATGGQGSYYLINGTRTGSAQIANAYSSTINLDGGDQPHNNMPPYIVVYRWVRTA